MFADSQESIVCSLVSWGSVVVTFYARAGSKAALIRNRIALTGFFFCVLAHRCAGRRHVICCAVGMVVRNIGEGPFRELKEVSLGVCRHFPHVRRFLDRR